MAIGPIDYAMIQRTSDVEMYKMQEETKPFVDQQNIQAQVTAREKMQSRQVVNSQDSEQTKNDADARKEGKGHYFSQQRNKKKEKEVTGKVVQKQEHGRFDMKI